MTHPQKCQFVLLLGLRFYDSHRDIKLYFSHNLTSSMVCVIICVPYMCQTIEIICYG